MKGHEKHVFSFLFLCIYSWICYQINTCSFDVSLYFYLNKMQCFIMQWILKSFANIRVWLVCCFNWLRATTLIWINVSNRLRKTVIPELTLPKSQKSQMICFVLSLDSACWLDHMTGHACKHQIYVFSEKL